MDFIFFFFLLGYNDAESRVAACENGGICKKLDWGEGLRNHYICKCIAGITDTPATVVVCLKLDNSEVFVTPDLRTSF